MLVWLLVTFYRTAKPDFLLFSAPFPIIFRTFDHYTLKYKDAALHSHCPSSPQFCVWTVAPTRVAARWRALPFSFSERVER